jgi:PAS domain S-box-containing protein
LDNHLIFQWQNKIFDITHVVDHINDFLAIFSSDGSCLYINRPFAALLGQTQHTLIHKINFDALVNNQEMVDEIHRSLKGDNTWYGPFQINTKINNLRVIMTFAAALDSNCSQFVVYFVPIGREMLETEVWDKLRDSEERYRTLVELSPNLIQIHSNGEITFINSAGVALLGAASANEVIGKSIFQYIHPREHPHVNRRIDQEIADREKMGPVEERWVRADGSEFDVEVIALPYEYHGQVMVQVIALDITDRKQAREQLNQYARRLLALNAIGLALVSSLNTNDVLEQVSRNLTDMLHASGLSILLKDRDDFVVVASIGEGASVNLDDRIPYSAIEKYIKSPSNEPIIISGEEVNAYPILFGKKTESLHLVRVMHGEEVIGVLQAHYSDSGTDQTAEQEILQSVSNWITVALQNSRLYQKERFQHQFAEGLLESATAINSNLDLSQVLERILQKVWQVIPCSAANIMVIEDEDARLVCSLGYDRFGINKEWIKTIRVPLNTLTHFQTIQKNRQPLIIRNVQSDLSWVKISGNEWIRSYAAAPLIVRDQVYGFLNLDSDKPDYFDEDTIQRLQAFAAQASIAIQNAQLVKDLQNALQHEQNMRAQLVQSEKLAAMGRMVASVAHELNNPLQTIQNCLFILEKEGCIHPDLQEYLNTGLAEVKRLSRMVDQLREAYRPSVQSGKILIRPIKLLENVHGLLKHQLEHKKIKWVISGESDFQIKAHVDPLKQVFINLAQNAIEAMEPDGGTLTIELRVNSDDAKAGILFRDTGRGIASEYLPNIFDPFYTTREMGFGLGLAICQDIVENLGGMIQVDSKPGFGSTFSVWLPIWIGE